MKASYSRLFKILFSLFALIWLPSGYAEEQASNLFQGYADRVYQIRVIEKSSGNKSAIGSGFQISADGIMASNYHVVSQAVLEPEKYRVEFLSHQNKAGQLVILDIDVVNDLALLQMQQAGDNFIRFSAQMPANGEEIYSLGNPLDLGLSVVPGTYNGFIKNSWYQRLHFTGGINSGMSGGPVINQAGELVGVNVATAGNQVGFLVPKQKLASLYEHYREHQKPVSDLKQRLIRELMDNQEKMIDHLVTLDWKTVDFSGARVAGEITPFITCWGDSNDAKEKLYVSVSRSCRYSDRIFLNESFETGTVEYEYFMIKNRALSPMRFYKLIETTLSYASPINRAAKDDVTNYECQTAYHKQPERKSVFCARAYIDFPGLYDILYFDARIGSQEQSLLTHFTLAGVSQKNALRFLDKILENTQWES